MRKLPKIRKINWSSLLFNGIGFMFTLVPPVGSFLFHFGWWVPNMDPFVFGIVFGYGSFLIPVLGGPVFLAGLWEDFLPSVKWNIVSRNRRAELKALRDRENAEYSAFLDAFDASAL